jgi:hypothetical protein
MPAVDPVTTALRPASEMFMIVFLIATIIFIAHAINSDNKANRHDIHIRME